MVAPAGGLSTVLGVVTDFGIAHAVGEAGARTG